MNPTYFLGMIIGVGIRLVVVNEWFMGAISMWRIADLLLRDLQILCKNKESFDN